MRVTLGPLSHNDHSVDPPRSLSQWERELFEHLRDDSYESAVIARQIANARVDAECQGHCPTVWITVGDTVAPLEDLRWGPTSGALPTIGISADADGMPINAIFQIADGYIREFDIHRDDGLPFRSHPAVQSFRQAPL